MINSSKDFVLSQTYKDKNLHYIQIIEISKTIKYIKQNIRTVRPF